MTNGYVKKQRKVDTGELERARTCKKGLGGAAVMSESTQPYNEIDDYIATFSDEERQEYVAAEMALDLANTLYHLRQAQGLTQREAAERAGLKQQAISRLEQAASNVQLSTLQRYLGALGYSIEISVIDNHTGTVAGKTSLSPA